MPSDRAIDDFENHLRTAQELPDDEGKKIVMRGMRQIVDTMRTNREITSDIYARLTRVLLSGK